MLVQENAKPERHGRLVRSEASNPKSSLSCADRVADTGFEPVWAFADGFTVRKWLFHNVARRASLATELHRRSQRVSPHVRPARRHGKLVVREAGGAYP